MWNIAHRGFSHLYPENTLRAFQKALEAGADGIECDVRMTKDNVLVLLHDADLKRLSGSSGKVESKNWSEICNLKIYQRESICRLSDLFDKLSPCILNLEIKRSERYELIVSVLKEELLKRSFEKPVFISSFCARILRAAHAALFDHPQFKLSFILNEPKKNDFTDIHSEDWLQSWNIHLNGFRRYCIKKSWPYQARPFWLWTLNQEPDWVLAYENRHVVQAIISDRPDEVAGFLKERRVNPLRN